MKLKEFAAGINMLLKDRPEAAEFDVVSAKDDEGNGFNLVSYEPSLGGYNREDREYHDEESEQFLDEGLPVDAVCIN